MAKSAANYANSALIKMEAIADGYTEGIALDVFGNVSEGSGQNIFLVRDGVIYTPPLGVVDPRRHHARLDHHARARSRLSPSPRRIMPREVLYIADEVFFVGTAAEVTPIRSVDKITDRQRAPRSDHRSAAARVLRRHQRRGAGHARLAHLRVSEKQLAPPSARASGASQPLVASRTQPPSMHVNDLLKIAVDERRIRPAPQGRQLPDDARPRRARPRRRGQAARSRGRRRDERGRHVDVAAPEIQGSAGSRPRLQRAGPRPLPLQHLPAARHRRPRPARHPDADPHDRRARPAAGAEDDRRGRARPRAGHRHDRQRQEHDARRDDRPHQQDALART